MKRLNKSILTSVLFLMAVAVYSQGIVQGTVSDGEMAMSLPGANIMVKGTKQGASTDFNGKYSVNVSQNKGVLVFTYVGFVTKEVPYTLVNGKATVNVTLMPDAESLNEVIVVGSGIIDVVKDRQTPIAVSTIPLSVIVEKAGNQEFPDLMKNTPSVQVGKQGDGYGEARVFVRGFDQDNTAYLINGQPINGMEDGKVYWSNWSGLSDIANAIQVQRGLGSSKLAISSVGGTVNIVTKATDKKEGGFVRATYANDNYVKSTIGYNTGLMKNGFGASVLFTHWQGDGYNYGTRGQGQNYFISLGWKLNDAHMLNFLVTGAPQWHDQNYSKELSLYLKYGRKYNSNFGTYQGAYMSARRNFYHKPIANLNWDWTISDKSSLATVLYASVGRGGGASGLGKFVNTSEGLIDFDKMAENNTKVIDGVAISDVRLRFNNAFITRASYNNHQWFGGVTNFQHKFNEKLTANIGADIRRYTGDHFRAVTNFLGLKAIEDNYSRRFHKKNRVTQSYTTNPWKVLTLKVDDNQKIDWNYGETITYGGIFGQVEYNTQHISTYLQGSLSKQYHQRVDEYQYDVNNQKSEKVTNDGFNIKGGFNWKVNEQHSLFVNAGYYSRQPYHDNIFLNYTNEVKSSTKNEKILGFEAGYQFVSDLFSGNLNLYRTSWKDRVTTKSNYDAKTGLSTHVTSYGLHQLHQGAEFDFKFKPSTFVNFNGFVSYGNWEYQDDVLKNTYDDNLNLTAENVENVKGGKVGNAPQLQAGLGVVVKPIERLKMDMDWRYNDELYADVVLKDNLKLPSYSVFDAGVSYEIPMLEKMNVKLRFNVNNLFNTIYISDVVGDRDGKIYQIDNTTTGIYKGLDTRNHVRFGYGRTWNFNVTFSF
ncbi:TonB-dependent receptor [Capnocytophaga canimorsus]|uniref:TonB-dependent receptor n=1 Tax=Capnocytophaga canimorsus TaxID=28188 RepID=UPI0037D20480